MKKEWKLHLKKMINTTGLFRFLDEHDSWMPLDIVDIVLTDETHSGYREYQHAKIIYDKENLLYMKTFFDEKIRKIDHYYVWQTTGNMGDDYLGYLLFPLNDGKYFKISYSC